ncbi:MAG: hypothetical protein PHX43_00865 [Alphaproteobacteria bacterium]|nr:hypothetical protein [Alphaproteobacteria bacterium]
MRAANEKFAYLGHSRQIWAVAAINGDLDRLVTLHDHIAARFSVGDRIVYLGNYLGTKSNKRHELIEELLAFRAALLAKPGMKTSDIVHLRGPAEEAWQRLLRLQFAPVPTQTLDKLLDYGVEAYLRLYNVSLNDTKLIARAGSVAITRWTNKLRDLQRKSAGHEALMCSTRRAAITQDDPSKDDGVLFVPAGFDDSRSLDDQGDSLWSGYFNISEGSRYFRVIRGFSFEHSGINLEGTAVTLDGGCGSGGPLACGCFDSEGNLLEFITVGGRGAVELLRRSETLPPPDRAYSAEDDQTDSQSPQWEDRISAAV